MLVILKQNVIKSLKRLSLAPKACCPLVLWTGCSGSLEKMELAAWAAALINFNTDATNFSHKMWNIAFNLLFWLLQDWGDMLENTSIRFISQEEIANLC